VFLDRGRATLKSGEFKRQDHFVERLLEESFSSTDIASALLHLLQAGEGTPTPKPTREEHPQHSESNGFREGHGDRHEKRTRQPFSERPVRAERRSSEPRHERPPRTSEQPVNIASGRHTSVKAVHAPAAAQVLPATPPESRPREQVVRPARPAESRDHAKPSHPPKASRRTPSEQTRLYIDVGAQMDVAPRDVVEAILGQTGLPANVVGTVDVRERHLFVDVAAEHANSIISKLNRTQIKGRKCKVKLA